MKLSSSGPAEFWREVERRIGDVPTNFPEGSVGHLVESYRASEEFKSKSESTQSSYSVHLRRFSAPEAWGLPMFGISRQPACLRRETH